MSNPAMEYRRLGRSGLFVSALGLGAWMTEDLLPDEETAVQVVKAALDGGCNFIDTAERYANGKSDILVGKVLKRLAVKRSDLVITTKIFWGNPGGPNDVGLSRKHIIEGTDAALQRLQLDYVDIIFAHRFDHETPLEETVRAFNHVINQGKAFYWGTSEWSARAIQEAQSIADRLGLIGPIVEQPQYNMFHRTRFEKEYAPLYSSIGLGTTIWSPLAGGILSGKYTSTKLEEAPEGSRLKDSVMFKSFMASGRGTETGGAEAMISKAIQLRPIADRLGVSLAQLALAWTLLNPNVSTVLTGSRRPEQVKDNLGALAVVPKLTPAVQEEIEQILANKPEPEFNARQFGAWLRNMDK
eukprot:TRINITY_DN2229_c0_g1_i1.p1 TRINITY_DN2229_c0_g1~~TRINITY_DN2229_c0_g1_i1.p1  ORF type:complete len:356 (+),score=91.45 TRINITY_DN2229_c0_g1_i1:121-1188(+)